MRIVSLIASSTEIVCALGLGESLVGRSHECDFPPEVKALPQCSAPQFAVDGSSREIDRKVKELLSQALSLYRVDTGALRELRPDVIITQSQCDVCAVSLSDVERALGEELGFSPRVISLAPQNLQDIFEDIERVGEALGVAERGKALAREMHGRMEAARVRSDHRPTVACIEWIDPLMAAGNWVPELIEIAGGVNLFGVAGAHSPWMTWEELVSRDPEVIVVMPCGFDLRRTEEEMAALVGHPQWDTLSAVTSGKVFLTDGNQYFNRPGPRIVDSLDILVEVLHEKEDVRQECRTHHQKGNQRWVRHSCRTSSTAPKQT